MAVAGSAAAPALRDVTLILALCKSSALVYKVIDLAAKDWHRSVDACVALLGDRGVTATAEKVRNCASSRMPRAPLTMMRARRAYLCVRT